MLQVKFNQIAGRFNHAYKVVEENDVDVLGTGYEYKETRKRGITTTGESTATDTRDNKFKDTPTNIQSVLNNPTNETRDDRTNASNAKTTENLDDTIDRKNTKHDEEMVVELSQLIDRYRQIDVEFINEFNECFMGVF